MEGWEVLAGWSSAKTASVIKVEKKGGGGGGGFPLFLISTNKSLLPQPLVPPSRGERALGREGIEVLESLSLASPLTCPWTCGIALPPASTRKNSPWEREKCCSSVTEHTFGHVRQGLCPRPSFSSEGQTVKWQT